MGATIHTITPNHTIPMIFVFYTLWSMGTYIKLFTTIPPNFCRRFEKVGELRSYANNPANSEYNSAVIGKSQLRFFSKIIFYSFLEDMFRNSRRQEKC